MAEALQARREGAITSEGPHRLLPPAVLLGESGRPHPLVSSGAQERFEGADLEAAAAAASVADAARATQAAPERPARTRPPTPRSLARAPRVVQTGFSSRDLLRPSLQAATHTPVADARQQRFGGRDLGAAAGAKTVAEARRP